MAPAGGDGVAVVVAEAAAATLVALGGWGAAASQFRRRADHEVLTSSADARGRVGVVVVVVVAAAAVVIAPVIGVFSALLALNHLLGTGENVPLSRYPMFSQPRERSWALRFEDRSGARVNVASLGILPPTARKRFAAELKAEQAKTDGVGGAHERAAGVVAEWIGQRRPATGPLASEPIAIVFVEYEFDGSVIRTRRRTLTVASPP